MNSCTDREYLAFVRETPPSGLGAGKTAGLVRDGSGLRSRSTKAIHRSMFQNAPTGRVMEATSIQFFGPNRKMPRLWRGSLWGVSVGSLNAPSEQSEIIVSVPRRHHFNLLQH